MCLKRSLLHWKLGYISWLQSDEIQTRELTAVFCDRPSYQQGFHGGVGAVAAPTWTTDRRPAAHARMLRLGLPLVLQRRRAPDEEMTSPARLCPCQDHIQSPSCTRWTRGGGRCWFEFCTGGERFSKAQAQGAAREMLSEQLFACSTPRARATLSKEWVSPPPNCPWLHQL